MKPLSSCLITITLLVLCGGLTNAGPKSPLSGIKREKSGQKEPSKERVLQIQQGMVAHGYPVEVTGKWDDQTKTALRKIADDMGWQVNHVPDARVLPLIGLGGSHQNPEVSKERGNHLDKLQRHELKDFEDSEN